MRCLTGLTGQDLANGLEAVAVSGLIWPPSAPEFRELCLSRGVSLLSADDAYRQILKFVQGGSRNYSLLSPETYWTYRQLDVWNWRQMNADKHEKTFKAEYKRTLEYARNGGEFPEVPVAAIEDTAAKGGGVKVSETNRKKGKRVLGELLGMMKGGSV